MARPPGPPDPVGGEGALAVWVPPKPVEWVDLGCGLGPVPRRTAPRRAAWTDPDLLLAAAALLAALVAVVSR